MRSTRAFALALAGLALLLVRLRLFPVRVAGTSMTPTLQPGDLLAVAPGLRPRPGDLVVVRARGTEMVKRVASALDGKLRLEGDNRAASTDLSVRSEDVAGVVLLRYRPRFTVLRGL
jgi:phage repressor protein C with HTH and peptisase S24 domain